MCFIIVSNVQSSVRNEGLSVTSRLSNTLAVMTSLYFVHQDILFLQPLLQSDCSRINPHTDAHSSAETKARLLRNAIIWAGHPPRRHKGTKGQQRRKEQKKTKNKEALEDTRKQKPPHSLNTAPQGQSDGSGWGRGLRRATHQLDWKELKSFGLSQGFEFLRRAGLQFT